jgi:hypothetical protein
MVARGRSVVRPEATSYSNGGELWTGLTITDNSRVSDDSV